MKNIAVIIYDLTVEYHITVVNGIMEYFNDKDDINVFIAPVSVPHSTLYDFDYQYWSSVEVLKNKNIDAYIVVVNSFTYLFSADRLSKRLKILGNRPVISVSVPLNLPKNRYSYISSRDAYDKIVEHLKNVHNRSKFAFFSAELDGSPESDERLESFKLALKKHNLEFNPDLVFPGDFTPLTTGLYLQEHYKTKEDIDFDALLCANDYMAVAAADNLERIGARVPEDVCVFGFDNADISVSQVPTISTVNQNVTENGYVAAELAYKSVTEKELPDNAIVNCYPLYRQSCGCIKNKRRTATYYDQNGIFHDQSDTSKSTLNLFDNALGDMSNIYHMLNMTDSVTDINDYFVSLVKILEKLYIEYFAACVYENEIELNPEDDFQIPEKAKLLLLYDKTNNVFKNYYEQDGIEFKTKQNLLPTDCYPAKKLNYFIFPISLKNKNYGYIICHLPMLKYTTYEIYLKIFANTFVHAFENSKSLTVREEMMERNRSLNTQSRTDELTQLLNRRGFMDYAQRLIDLSIVTETNGCVFFFDLDGLKKINDTYGHKMGDMALATAAQVLKDTFHKSDLVGRLSGDEFAALAPGFDEENVEFIRERIIELCKEYSVQNKLPFTISTSLGVVNYNSEKKDLQKLLLEADKLLYEEKKIKHGK